MGNASLATLLSAAANYESAVVPALTGEWAPRVVAAAGIRPGHRVLDVACGTGALTREVARTVGAAGSVIGLDPDPGMLTIARRVSPGISWQRGAAESLPFPDESFDTVVSQFGMMFFPDRAGALREMWRVLRPGGRLVVAVWASLHETPAYATQVELVERIAGARAAEVLRSPFVLGDPLVFGRVFSEAGISLDSLATCHGRGMFPSIAAMLETDLVEWLPAAGVMLDKSTIARILEEGQLVFAPYRQADGTVRFESPAVIAVATR